MLSDQEMYERMINGWRGGLAEGTPCGAGSLLANTAIIRAWLPEICKRHKIASVCDAGAGDLHWIQHIDWPVQYSAFDLIPRAEEVEEIDITTEALPECDAILCRMVLNHLGKERTAMALDLFRESATYLIATHFVCDRIKRVREFTRLDLTEWLGEPIEMARDGHEEGCRLAIWEL